MQDQTLEPKFFVSRLFDNKDFMDMWQVQDMDRWRLLCGFLAAVGVLSSLALFCIKRYANSHPGSGRTQFVRSAAYVVGFMTSPAILIFLFWPNAPWWVIVGIPTLVLLANLRRLSWIVSALRSQSRRAIALDAVPLENVHLKGPEVGVDQHKVLRVAHLSDIHLSCSKTMETGLPGEKTWYAFEQALEWSLANDPDVVLITGDITDAGEEREWEAFRAFLCSLKPEYRERIIFVTGNHDLTTLRTEESTPNRDLIGVSGGGAVPGIGDGYLFMAQERSCYSFVTKILPLKATAWDLISDTGRTSLGGVLSDVAQFVEVYDTNRPQLGLAIRMGLHYFVKHHMRLPRGLSDLKPDFLVDPSLLKVAQSWTGSYPWPTATHFLLRDFVETAYPMILFETPDFIIIGLNSCVQDPGIILTSAVGALGKRQLSRLATILDAVRNKAKILILHHHIGIPQDASWLGLYVDPLSLSDAWALHRLLAGHERLVVFHGHKHVGYHASTGGVRIISAPSVAYGDKADFGKPNCFVYGITTDGTPHVISSERIVAA